MEDRQPSLPHSPGQALRTYGEPARVLVLTHMICTYSAGRVLLPSPSSSSSAPPHTPNDHLSATLHVICIRYDRSINHSSRSSLPRLFSTNWPPLCLLAMTATNRPPAKFYTVEPRSRTLRLRLSRLTKLFFNFFIYFFSSRWIVPFFDVSVVG